MYNNNKQALNRACIIYPRHACAVRVTVVVLCVCVCVCVCLCVCLSVCLSVSTVVGSQQQQLALGSRSQAPVVANN